MEIWQLKESILANNIPNLMIFTGEETKIRDIYVDKISEVLKSPIKKFETINQYINTQTQKSLYKEEFNLVVIKEDTSIFSNEGLWEVVGSFNKKLILIFNKIDKKTKFYKRFEGNITTFNRMDKETLQASIVYKLSQEGLNLKQSYVEWLVEACSGDYGRILNELDKILIFKKEPIDFNEMFKRFAKDGVIHYDVPDSIFEFVNAITSRNKDLAMSTLEDVKLLSSPIAIISLLYNNFRNIILVQTAAKPTAESIGMNSKQFSAIKYKTGKYTSQQLVEILLTLGDLDRKIKQGQIDSSIAIEYLIMKVF